MTELTQQDGNPVIHYQARDYQSLLQAMRQLIPQKMPEWLDYTNEADLGNVLLELFAQMGDILSYYQDRVANEGFLGTARSRRRSGLVAASTSTPSSRTVPPLGSTSRRTSRAVVDLPEPLSPTSPRVVPPSSV